MTLSSDPLFEETVFVSVKRCEAWGLSIPLGHCLLLRHFGLEPSRRRSGAYVDGSFSHPSSLPLFVWGSFYRRTILLTLKSLRPSDLVERRNTGLRNREAFGILFAYGERKSNGCQEVVDETDVRTLTWRIKKRKQRQ